MKTKLFLFLLCLTSLNVMGQGVITRNSTRKTEPKKQNTEQPAKRTPTKKQGANNQSQKSRLTTNTINGHEWVDLGLSVKWATCNVGASSPSDYGGYYAWGETRTKSSYNWSNCFDCVNTWKSSDAGWRKYKIGGQTRITPTSGRDTARENWGGTWRMPTDAECEELCRMCKWTLTGKRGHFGYTVTGPNGNSIYLPAAGWHWDLRMECVGERGRYWSCTLDSTDSDCARGMYFTEISEFGTTRPYRFEGLSVRPVTE